MERPTMRLVAPVLGTPDPHRLAEFYQQLLGWPIGTDEPDWVTLRPAGGAVGLSFQEEPTHVPPTWPQVPGEQQMMVHLDIEVDDLDTAVAWAVEAGATEASFQPQEEVRVMIDPDGHPFCLFSS